MPPPMLPIDPLWATPEALDLIAATLVQVSPALAPRLDTLFDPMNDWRTERSLAQIASRVSIWTPEVRKESAYWVGQIEAEIMAVVRDRHLPDDDRIPSCAMLLEILGDWMEVAARSIEEAAPDKRAKATEHIGRSAELVVWVIAMAAQGLKEKEACGLLLSRVPQRVPMQREVKKPARAPRRLHDAWVTAERLAAIQAELREIIPTLGPLLDDGFFDRDGDAGAERTMPELARRATDRGDAETRAAALSVIETLDDAMMGIMRERSLGKKKIESCTMLLEVFADSLEWLRLVVASEEHGSDGMLIHLAGSVSGAFGHVILTAARSIDERELVERLAEALPSGDEFSGPTVH